MLEPARRPEPVYPRNSVQLGIDLWVRAAEAIDEFDPAPYVIPGETDRTIALIGRKLVEFLQKALNEDLPFFTPTSVKVRLMRKRWQENAVMLKLRIATRDYEGDDIVCTPAIGFGIGATNIQ